MVPDQALGSTAGASQLAGLDLAQTQAKPGMASIASMASMHSQSCLSYLEQVRIKPWSVIRHLGALLGPETHQKSIISLFKNHLKEHLTAGWPGLE